MNPILTEYAETAKRGPQPEPWEEAEWEVPELDDDDLDFDTAEEIWKSARTTSHGRLFAESVRLLAHSLHWYFALDLLTSRSPEMLGFVPKSVGIDVLMEAEDAPRVRCAWFLAYLADDPPEAEQLLLF